MPGMFPADALNDAAEIVHSFKLLCKNHNTGTQYPRQANVPPNTLLSPHPLIFLGGNDSISLSKVMES